MRVWLCIGAICLLPISCDDETEKKVGLVTFNVFQGSLGEIPVVSSIVNAAAPFVEMLLGEQESSELKAIKDVHEAVQQGFREMRNQLKYVMGHLNKEIQLDIVRDVETKANVYLQLLGDIVEANTSFATNETIHSFLKNCRRNDPYEAVLKMANQVPIAIKLQFQDNPFRKAEPITSMKKRLYGILHELSIAVVYQEFLLNKTEEERNPIFTKLARKMDEINNNTEALLEEYRNYDYWPELYDMYKDAVEAPLLQSNLDFHRSQANLTWKLLQEMYTNNRFCLIDYKYEGPVIIKNKLYEELVLFNFLPPTPLYVFGKNKDFLKISTPGSRSLYILRSSRQFNSIDSYFKFRAFMNRFFPPTELFYCTPAEALQHQLSEYGNGIVYPKSGSDKSFNGLSLPQGSYYATCDYSSLTTFEFSCYDGRSKHDYIVVARPR